MRYQERIYIQNENSSVRNKDILNVNMSSDICVFESPLFNLSGASKIDCTGTTGTSYVISTATTIPLTFQFTANTNTFTANTTTFKYEIYKYNSDVSAFMLPPIYKSEIIEYSGFSATSTTTQNIPVSGLSLDGEYLVKGYYEFNACTEFLNKLGKKVDTLIYRTGVNYGLYEPKLDYSFMAMTAAEEPKFLVNNSNTPPANQLFQQILLPNEGETTVIITNNYYGFFVLTLNGLVLSRDLDYTYTGNVVTLNAKTVEDDVISIIYTTSGGNNLVGDTIYVNSEITSGTTNNEGSNTSYYNTTTGKYEIYTNVTPSQNGSILVMINGATLADGIDYYQSISNPKRIILEGNLKIDDVIVIVYFPMTNVINGITTNNPSVFWTINMAPQLTNGYFSLEVSTGTSFTTLYFSGSTDYIVNNGLYGDSFIVSGIIGEKFYYRVKNVKNYITLCGNVINSTAYSEIIPFIIQTNAINSY